MQKANCAVDPPFSFDSQQRRWASDTRSFSTYVAAAVFGIFGLATVVLAYQIWFFAPLPIFLIWKFVKTVKSIGAREEFEIVFDDSHVSWGWAHKADSRERLALSELESVKFITDNEWLFLKPKRSDSIHIKYLELKSFEGEQLLRYVRENLHGVNTSLEGISPWDPEKAFEDPVAVKTYWSHSMAASSGQTHTLVKQKNGNYRYRPGSWNLGVLTVVSLVLVALLLFFISLPFMASLDNSDSPVENFLVVFGVSFVFSAGVAFFLLFFGWALLSSTALKLFDMASRQYKWVSYGQRFRRVKNSINLDDVHACQLVSTYYSGSDSSMTCWQFALVLKDGSRVPVVNHEGFNSLKYEVEHLAALMRVPVWSTENVLTPSEYT